MLMLGLNKTIDHFAMANNVHCYGQTLRRKGGHISRRALDIEVKGQRKKRMMKMAWKKQVEEESMKVGLRREIALCLSKWNIGVNHISAGLR